MIFSLHSDLAGKIDYMLLQAEHESPQVRTAALQNLIEIIRNSKLEFESLMNANKVTNFFCFFLIISLILLLIFYLRY